MIKYSDIEDAFDYVSSEQPFLHNAILNRKTGKIYYQSEMGDVDEFPEDCDSGYYVEIPHKNDLGLGRDLVFDFVAISLSEYYDDVIKMFRYRGAYRRYKSLLESKSLLQQWYDYENKRTDKALREWCEDNDLNISE